MLPVLFGFAAVSVDLTVAFLEAERLQAALDAAASVGAMKVAQDSNTVKKAAVTAADLNGLTITTADVQIGEWDDATSTLDTASTTPDAVMVSGKGATMGGFWRMIASAGITPSDTSIAKSGGVARTGHVACTLYGGDVVVKGSSSLGVSDLGAGEPSVDADEASVCSGSEISLGGSSTMDIDAAAYGTTNLASSAGFTGTQHPLNEEPAMPVIDWAYYKANNDNALVGLPASGPINMNGSDLLILTAGDYWMDSLRLNGNASIQTVGEVNLYIGGNLTEGGKGFVNTGGDPADLYVYVGGDAKMGGTADFFGSVIAPAGDITLGGGAGFAGGAVAYGTLTISGTPNLSADVGVDPWWDGLDTLELLEGSRAVLVR